MFFLVAAEAVQRLVSTMSNRWFSASCISAWKPACSNVRTGTAWSVHRRSAEPCRSAKRAADAQLTAMDASAYVEE